MIDSRHASFKRLPIGVFLVSAAVLMYEVLLTRIFSVTMWYHFAFMAISVAMFGAAAGAIIVFAAPRVFGDENAVAALTWTTLLFETSVAVMFIVHVRLASAFVGMDTISTAAAAFATVSVPFIFGGMSICIALTKFPFRFASLYASDLIGAALGCIAVVGLLAVVDAPTAVFGVAFVASLGAVAFASSGAPRTLQTLAVLGAFFFLALVSVSFFAARHGKPLVRLLVVKGKREAPAVYERWNSFSRIRVEGNPNEWRRPFGWGLSPTQTPQPVHELSISIDSASGTVLTGFNGDLSAVEYLRYDATNIAHWLRPNADVVVIGTGGGRDVLSAMVFRQKRITGIEINGAILNAANGAFGDFTGHLNRRPGVTFINDEARSYLERTPSRHDIIQVTLIDTWAATSVGAFALTENSLYTVEAWNLFLNRLTDHGILTVSRWYRPKDPSEVYRLVSLATATLMRRGVANPRDHLLLLKSRSTDAEPVDVATLLVSPKPFQPADVALFDQTASRLKFDVALTPQRATEPVIGRLASIPGSADEFPADLSAPTDDRPFFFNFIRLGDITKRARLGITTTAALRTLFVVAAAIALLTACGILLPLRLTARSTRTKPLSAIMFFAAIGFGFMLIEVAQLQRLSLFLGHPTYAMVVALPTLLLSSGLGSYSLRRSARREEPSNGIVRLMLLTASVAAAGLVTPSVLRSASASPMWIHIVVCMAVLAIPGFLMGMAFPIGMSRVAGAEDLLPWFWGINGAASVFATVVAMILSTTWGISSTFWTGTLMYGVALAAHVVAIRRETRAVGAPSEALAAAS